MGCKQGTEARRGRESFPSLVNYSDLDGGWMDEAFNDLGYDSDQIWDVSNGDDLLNQISNELAAGKAVTMAINTPYGGAPVIGSHAYTVVSVDTDAQGIRRWCSAIPGVLMGSGMMERMMVMFG